MHARASETSAASTPPRVCDRAIITKPPTPYTDVCLTGAFLPVRIVRVRLEGDESSPTFRRRRGERERHAAPLEDEGDLERGHKRVRVRARTNARVPDGEGATDGVELRKPLPRDYVGKP